MTSAITADIVAHGERKQYQFNACLMATIYSRPLVAASLSYIPLTLPGILHFDRLRDSRRSLQKAVVALVPLNDHSTILWHTGRMPDEDQLSLRQADQIRGDLHHLDFIKVQLARLPTRNEVWCAAMLGGAVAAVTLIEAFAHAIRPCRPFGA